MDGAQHQAAKRRMVAQMVCGIPWSEAAVQAGVRTSRTAAYRLLHAVRRDGDVALRDGRHGHATKLREPVRHWPVANTTTLGLCNWGRLEEEDCR